MANIKIVTDSSITIEPEWLKNMALPLCHFLLWWMESFIPTVSWGEGGLLALNAV